jgi:type IV pilus assembly protein PilN
MQKINLLFNLMPWREKLRKKQKKQFIFCCSGMVFVAVMIISIIHFSLAAKIRIQKDHNKMLRQEILLLTHKTEFMDAALQEKSMVTAQLKFMDGLKKNRTVMLDLFVELEGIIPDDIFLIRIKREDNTVLIAGKAEVSTSVSRFMANIEKSNGLTQPLLDEIKTLSSQKPYATDFTAQFQINKKKTDV